jgi:dipeptidyl aminopeptidase/acylaminoacyl peptidase
MYDSVYHDLSPATPMPRTFLAVALAAVLLGATTPVLAQKTAAEIPVETFFKRFEVSQMQLSPNGEKLAALASFNGRDNLVVVDVAKKTRQVLTSFSEYDVAGFTWINDKRLYFRVIEARDVLKNARYMGTFAIDVDGENLRNLTDLVGGKQPRGTSMVADIEPLARTTDNSDDMIVAMNHPRFEAEDVHVLDTRTGRSKKRLTVDAPADTIGYVLDWDRIPRVATSLEPRTATYRVWYRDGLDSPWTELMSYPLGNAVERIRPIAFNADNKTLFVASNVGRDKAAIYTYDPKSKKLGDLVFEHPMIDVWGGLVMDRNTHKLLGIRYLAERDSVVWIDPDYKRVQAQVDATLPGKVNSISRGSDNPQRFLIHSYSDTDAGRFFLLHRDPLRMEELLAARPGLKPELMSPTRFITYKARDGLEIPAWVTIPKASSGKNLPLVVNIHGGPATRSYGGYDTWYRPEAQFLASRGYVVLEPEPRASTGFGRKHSSSSFKQWGLAMQDDITDGVLHLVKEGIVDKNRVCLYGASYGGYATLQGLVREPDLFKCGIPFVAVSDLPEVLTSNESDTNMDTKVDYSISQYKEIGDPSKDRELLRSVSPAYNAKRIKAPVLLAMGQIDKRVPLIHGTRMRDALQEAGVKVDYVVYSGEGHGWNKQDNLNDWYKRVEKFLAENLK